MDRALIKKSIDDWKQYFIRVNKTAYIRKVDLEKPNYKMAKALIGVRRSGKTTIGIQLLKDINPEEVFYYNFEDPLFYANSSATDLEKLISVAEEYSKSKIRYLVLDEIQNVPGWEKWLRKSIDLQKYKIIVTGSSAKLLSSELATAIAGRALKKTIWPLSFSEFLKFKNQENQSDNYLSYFREYLEWGGFPEVVLTENENDKRDILNQYLNDIVLKDVISRNEIRAKRALDQIINYYFTNLSSLHSYSAIKKAFSISIDTSKYFTEVLSEAFVVFELERFHTNLKVQSRDSRKVYIIDNGLRKVAARSIQDDTGKLLENIVFLELKRRNKELMYFKGKQEVDFLILENYKPIEAIQVCASSLEDSLTYKREVSAMIECLEFCNLSKGIILSWDREEKLTKNNKEIEFIPAYKWMLNSN